MTKESHSSIPDTPEVDGLDLTEIENPEDATLRRQLGIRPIYFPQGGQGQHPDQSPCPKWCWATDGSHHEVEPDHPLVPTHTTEDEPCVMASLYQANYSSGGDYIQAATIEPGLHQLGQGDPIIRIAFRHYEGRKYRYDAERLRLTLTEAEELVSALRYLIDLAEA